MLTAFSPTSPGPRRVLEGIPCIEETHADWANLVRAEYCEIPGLSLTAAQAERLWNLDPALARAVLTYLTDTGFLRGTKKGTYIRADAPCA